MPRIRVLICSQIRLYRDGLTHALRDDATVEVVASAASPEEAARSLPHVDADVILVDVAERDVLELLGAIAAAVPDLPIVALAVSGRPSDVLECAEAGALGYVTRDGGIEDLRATIEGVHRGELVCPPEIAASLMRRVGALARDRRRAGAILTVREHEIAVLARSGLSNKQIAGQLCIELATVKNHMHAVLAKLEISRRAEIPDRIREYGRI